MIKKKSFFQRKKNKFKAARTNGFSSKLENAVHEILLLREKAGEISDIKCQQSVKLTEAQISYRTDFSFVTKDNKTCWVEAKGYEGETWRLKKKLWKYYGPGPLEIYKGSFTKPFLDEVIIPV